MEKTLIEQLSNDYNIPDDRLAELYKMEEMLDKIKKVLYYNSFNDRILERSNVDNKIKEDVINYLWL